MASYGSRLRSAANHAGDAVNKRCQAIKDFRRSVQQLRYVDEQYGPGQLVRRRRHSSASCLAASLESASTAANYLQAKLKTKQRHVA